MKVIIAEVLAVRFLIVFIVLLSLCIREHDVPERSAMQERT